MNISSEIEKFNNPIKVETRYDKIKSITEATTNFKTTGLDLGKLEDIKLEVHSSENEISMNGSKFYFYFSYNRFNKHSSTSVNHNLVNMKEQPVFIEEKNVLIMNITGASYIYELHFEGKNKDVLLKAVNGDQFSKKIDCKIKRVK